MRVGDGTVQNHAIAMVLTKLEQNLLPSRSVRSICAAGKSSCLQGSGWCFCQTSSATLQLSTPYKSCFASTPSKGSLTVNLATQGMPSRGGSRCFVDSPLFEACPPHLACTLHCMDPRPSLFWQERLSDLEPENSEGGGTDAHAKRQCHGRGQEGDFPDAVLTFSGERTTPFPTRPGGLFDMAPWSPGHPRPKLLQAARSAAV